MKLKFLTLESIKQHTRIDFDCEDGVLDSYGQSAEATVLNQIGRTYEELVWTYGEIPAPIIHAALMLVDLSYQQRSPVSPQNLYLVPYTFDLLIKPYVKL